MDAHGHGGAVGGQDESPTAVEENVQVCWFCERLPTFDTFQVQHFLDHCWETHQEVSFFFDDVWGPTGILIVQQFYEAKAWTECYDIKIDGGSGYEDIMLKYQLKTRGIPVPQRFFFVDFTEKSIILQPYFEERIRRVKRAQPQQLQQQQQQRHQQSSSHYSLSSLSSSQHHQLPPNCLSPTLGEMTDQDNTPQAAAALGVPSSQPASPSMGPLGESHQVLPPPPPASPPPAASAEAQQDGGSAPTVAAPTAAPQDRQERADQQPVPFPTNGLGEVVGRCRWHGCTSETEYTSGFALFTHWRDTHQGSVPAMPNENPKRYACSWGNGTTSGDGVCADFSRGYSATKRNHLGSHIQTHIRRSGLKDASMEVYKCKYHTRGCICQFHNSKSRTLHQIVCPLAPDNAQPAGDAGAEGGVAGAVEGGDGGLGEEEEEAVGGKAVSGEKRKRGDEEEEDEGRGKEARVE